MFVLRILSLLRRLLCSRPVWIGLMGTVVCCCILHFISVTHYVTVYDFEGEGLLHFQTENTQLDALLEEAGVTIGKHDVVTFSGEATVMEIEIDRAYPVYVTADGLTSRVYVTDATVGEALTLCGVELSPNDQLDMALNRPMYEGDEVNVTRVDYVNDFYTEEIPYSVYYDKSSLLRTGAKRAIQRGKPGEQMVFTREKYINGELTASFVQDTLVTAEPKDTRTLLGQAGYAISPYCPFEGVTVDANGKPTNAVEVRRGMRTVSYYTGHTCASGLPAQPGHIGVNPRVFPYGTRLYIESEDGSFVYGYCIAADCGPGTLKNVIDFDLFYDTYNECALMGRRNDIVVYILPDGPIENAATRTEDDDGLIPGLRDAVIVQPDDAQPDDAAAAALETAEGSDAPSDTPAASDTPETAVPSETADPDAPQPDA